MRPETKVFVITAVIAAAIVPLLDALTWLAIGDPERIWADSAILTNMATAATPFILAAVATLLVSLSPATAWRIAGIGLFILGTLFGWLAIDGYMYQTQNGTGGANIGLYMLIMLGELITAILMPVLVLIRGKSRRASS
ncbi:MAG: hypothetical protein ACSHXB_14070 [Sulfitobacter sp.]